MQSDSRDDDIDKWSLNGLAQRIEIAQEIFFPHCSFSIQEEGRLDLTKPLHL